MGSATYRQELACFCSLQRRSHRTGMERMVQIISCIFQLKNKCKVVETLVPITRKGFKVQINPLSYNIFDTRRKHKLVIPQYRGHDSSCSLLNMIKIELSSRLQHTLHLFISNEHGVHRIFHNSQ
jgi:hypothetical protein